jgi:hypothetical protein
VASVRFKVVEVEVELDFPYVRFSHTLIYLHSMDPYMARKPVDIEIVNVKKTSHVNNIITN